MRIELRSLTKSFQATPALEDVSFDIEPGQIVAVLGPNGAGKSTLLRCLAGILVPEAGEILFDGEAFCRSRDDLRRRVCIQPDFPFVFPDMTVLEHIGLVLRLYEADRRGIEERVIDLLDDFDMLPLAETKMGTLSRGQTYKGALVALLAADPELWMFDEPFASGMDPRGLNSFRRHAFDAITRGRTVLYTTQILELAEDFSDRVCILHQGRLHAFDTVTHLQQQTRAETHGVLANIFERLHEVPT
jgi:ABC-type multidrug transport system ATPase subunit